MYYNKKNNIIIFIWFVDFPKKRKKWGVLPAFMTTHGTAIHVINTSWQSLS